MQQATVTHCRVATVLAYSSELAVCIVHKKLKALAIKCYTLISGVLCYVYVVFIGYQSLIYPQMCPYM